MKYNTIKSKMLYVKEGGKKMNQANKTMSDNEKTFENIKHFDEFGNEYWEARELQIALTYTLWQKFLNVLEKAKVACENSGYDKIR